MSKRQMVIHYVPGEECRVAIVQDGKLEEFHAERMDGPSNHVGSIYVGKVANVEPGIQAAFVDFGLEHNGFLHTSDVHPQYFPGEDTDKTERVGRKTPRRERPRSRTASAAAMKSPFRSSRKASAPRARPSPVTSPSPGASS